MKVALIFLFKVLIIASLIFIGYYFILLKPKIDQPQKLAKTQTILSSHKNSLIQNKVSFVELSKLNPNSPGFEYEKKELVETLKVSIENGKASIENPEKLPDINKGLSERHPGLLEETKQVYLDQEQLLKKVFATKSFEEGVEIMRSDESIRLLTKQTNLILEYDFWIETISTQG